MRRQKIAGSDFFNSIGQLWPFADDTGDGLDPADCAAISRFRARYGGADGAASQCPVMRYNRELMMAILWDRMPYLTTLLNTEVIPLEGAIEACKISRTGRRRSS